MPYRSAQLLFGVIVCVVAAKADEPARGRIIEGIVSSGGKPVKGVKLFFSEAAEDTSYVEGAVAESDAQGRIRIDLSNFPWSKGVIRTLAMSPGFDLAERKIEQGLSSVDVGLTALPWEERVIRLENGAGKTVADVEVNVAVREIPWERVKSDGDGRCRFLMVPGVYVRLTAKPKGARPIEATINVARHGQHAFVLPVLPPYSGIIVDAQGRPAVGAVVGNGWITEESEGVPAIGPFYRDTVTSDGEGRFTFPLPLQVREHDSDLRYPKLESLVFADSSFKKVEFLLFSPTQAKESIRVTLRPTRPVRISFEPLTIVAKAEFETEISIIPSSERPDQRFLFLLNRRERKGDGDMIEVNLPEGTYRLNVDLFGEKAGEYFGRAERELVVPKGEGSLTLPLVKLISSAHQRMVGKPAPEIDANDLDTGKPVTLNELRGKVVVLDFWGYWCGPCIGTMPKLMELHRKFAGRPLEIVALHDQSVQTRAEYDKMIAPARRFWERRDLPFRVLLDKPYEKKPADRESIGIGTTIERYHIEGFPTLFVIDHEGTLVAKIGHSEPEKLESLIRNLLDKAGK